MPTPLCLDSGWASSAGRSVRDTHDGRGRWASSLTGAVSYERNSDALIVPIVALRRLPRKQHRDQRY
jgi:hypothetical protein